MGGIDSMTTSVLLSPRRRWLRHLLLQAVVLAISSSVLWDGNTVPDGGRIAVWLAYYIFMDVLVYVNIFLLVRLFLLKGRVTAYLFSVTGIVLTLVTVIGVLQSLLPGSAGEGGGAPVLIGIFSSVAALGFLFAGTSALVLFRQWILASRRRKQLETENLRAELLSLRNQINPHFLFNMLNNCHLLVKKGRPESRQILLRLEELLRYQIGEAGKEKVRLKDEISFLEDFLSLEKIRRDNFRYRVEDTTGCMQIEVPPLLFIMFVENSVKHSNDSENLSFVDISFRMEGRRLAFECVNSIPTEPVGSGGRGGLGLKNIKRRLELLFPGSHRLVIDATGCTYRVTLKLEL